MTGLVQLDFMVTVSHLKHYFVVGKQNLNIMNSDNFFMSQERDRETFSLLSAVTPEICQGWNSKVGRSGKVARDWNRAKVCVCLPSHGLKRRTAQSFWGFYGLVCQEEDTLVLHRLRYANDCGLFWSLFCTPLRSTHTSCQIPTSLRVCMFEKEQGLLR